MAQRTRGAAGAHARRPITPAYLLPSDDFDLLLSPLLSPMLPDDDPDDVESLLPDCELPVLLVPDELPLSSPERWQAASAPAKNTGIINRASHR